MDVNINQKSHRYSIHSGSNASTDQLVIAQAYFQVVVDRIIANGHSVPANLARDLENTTKELNQRMILYAQRELAIIKMKRESVLPTETKLTNYSKQIEVLETELEELLKK